MIPQLGSVTRQDVAVLSGLPDSIKTILVVVIAVIPGACFVWGYERIRHIRAVGSIEVTGDQPSPGERILLFVVATVGYHLLVGWPEYFLWHHYQYLSHKKTLTSAGFGLLWSALLAAVLLPSFAGWLTGRWWPLTSRPDDPWRMALADLGYGFVLVATANGGLIGGLFGTKSLAGLGERRDLYLEQAYQVLSDGNLGDPLGYSVFIRDDEIRSIILLPAELEES